MCSDSAPAPAADPNIGKAALEQARLGGEYLDVAKRQGAEQAQLGREYLDFTKQQFAVSQTMQDDLRAKASEVSDYFLNIAKSDRARYETEFKPIEDAFVKQATEFDSPERQAEYAARARSTVLSNAATERATAQRREQAAGVRPDAGRYAGVDRAVGLGTALASADAQNNARDAVRDKGLALKGAAIDIGSKLPGQAATGVSSSLNAATLPISTQAGTVGIVGAGYGGAAAGLTGQAATTGSGYGGAMTGQKNLAGTLEQLHKDDITVWDDQNKIDAANAAGIGQFAGTALGALTSGGTGGFKNSAAGSAASGIGTALQTGLMFLSSKKAKTNRKDVPEGKSLDAVEKMPVQTFDYKPGQGDGGSHVGPMAEDFAKATGKGDGTGIAVQDAIGIAMGAIKDLSGKVDRMAEAIGLGNQKRPATA